MMDLSPEEILRKREEEGGLKYDPFFEEQKTEVGTTVSQEVNNRKSVV